jgi:hypothetical protein
MGMADHRYEHDARRGETRFPPQEGSQYGGRRGERDPHERLNTPVSEAEAEVDPGHGGGVDVRGMGRPQKHGSPDAGDPELPESSRGDRETRNEAQTTRRGIPDAEREAMRDAEEKTGVPLTGERRPEGENRR